MITSTDQTLKAVPRLSVASCPQCGAAVSMPHDADSVVCPVCGSSLTKVGGVLVQVVSERVDVTRAQAEDWLRAWISKSVSPGLLRGRSRAEQTSTTVGDLRFFPFLKISETNGEKITPLAALPSPWVAELGHAPGQMLDVADHGQGLVASRTAGPMPAGLAPTAPGPALTPPDLALVEETLTHALTDPAVSRVLVEYRGYYPAKYSMGDVDGRSYAAIIAAGQGIVYGERPPSRRRTARDQAVFLGTAALLLAEAAFVPGLYLRLIAVLVTVLVAWIVVTWTVVRHG